MTARADDKSGLHPRNRHRARYDFVALTRSFPALARFVGPNPHDGGPSVDFADPAAVKALNQALLRHFYGLAHWELPDGYLCPPIPGRADYLHHVADLLALDHGGEIPRGPGIVVLDVGVGANCVYPIIGTHEYGWRFVGSEVDPVALRSAQRIVAANPGLSRLVECRPQTAPPAIFRGIIRLDEHFALTVCNPPFHASRAAATAGTQRKLKNLRGPSRAHGPTKAVLNFGGQPTELWCAGGELGFVRRMIAESTAFAQSCRWFTTLLSKSAHLPLVEQALARAQAAGVRIIPMRQGQKQSRLVAWTFLAPGAGRRH